MLREHLLKQEGKAFYSASQLARHHIADQDHDKIDKVILTEAYTSKAYLVLDFFQDPCMSQPMLQRRPLLSARMELKAEILGQFGWVPMIGTE